MEYCSKKEIPTKDYLILDEDVVWDSGKRGNCWECGDFPWITIYDGYWFIARGTAWDGATMVPDGAEDPNKAGYPITWLASLIHDLGVYFLHTVDDFPYSKRQIDRFFFIIMAKAGFKWAWVFFVGVRVFGGVFGYFSRLYRKITKTKSQHDPTFLYGY